MKLVYVAGPYSAPKGTPQGERRYAVGRNIRAAEDCGVEIALLGGFPVIPHANTSDPRFELAQPYTFWVEATLELLKRCDALFALPNWADSDGAIGEVDWAGKNNMPTFFSLPALKEWLGSGARIDGPFYSSFREGGTFSNVLTEPQVLSPEELRAAIERLKAIRRRGAIRCLLRRSSPTHSTRECSPATQATRLSGSDWLTASSR